MALSAMKEEQTTPMIFNEKDKVGGSRVMAVVGRDGTGKSKVCAALLELKEDGGGAAKAGESSFVFADKSRLLEAESAENRRNFSCYNHTYAQHSSSMAAQRLHLIDTPGHVERAVLVDHALRPAHGAIVVCSARTGVDADCGRGFAAVQRAGKPAVIFLNGVDQADDADSFEAALDAMERRLGLRPVVLFAPAHLSGIPCGSRLLNVLDGSLCSELDCTLELDGDGQGGDKPAQDLAAWCSKLREQQIESLAAVDDEMMEAFVEFDGDVPRVIIEAALQRAVAAGAVMPLVAGSAKTGLGIDALQDVVHEFIPPGDGEALLESLGTKATGDVSFSRDAHFLGWAFALREPLKDAANGERLLEVLILDGSLRKNASVRFQGREPLEEFGITKVMFHGHRGELVETFTAGPGDLVVIPAPSWLDKEALASGGLALASHRRYFDEAPSPASESSRLGSDAEPTGSSFALRLEGLDKRAHKNLLDALEALQREDDGLSVRLSQCGEHILSCAGLLHLELVRERLAEEFGILELRLGKPQVEYQSTVKGKAQATGKHAPKSKMRMRKGIVTHGGSSTPDAWVKVEVAPTARGTGVEVEGVGSAACKVPEDAQEAIERGVRRGLLRAGPGGVPVTDVVVRVTGAEAQSAESVADAAEAAVQKAAQQEVPGTLLLEPVASLQIDVPEGIADAVSDDLRLHRRGQVWTTQNSEEGRLLIDAEAPVREILDYAPQLHKLTDSQGHFSYRPVRFQEVGRPLVEDILKEELHASPEH